MQRWSRENKIRQETELLSMGIDMYIVQHRV